MDLNGLWPEFTRNNGIVQIFNNLLMKFRNRDERWTMNGGL